jgi:hypothetical protein
MVRVPERDRSAGLNARVESDNEVLVNLPPIDDVAARVHAAWVEEKRAAGVTSRPSGLTGQEQLVPFADLAEEDKESNRMMIRTVYKAIQGE